MSVEGGRARPFGQVNHAEFLTGGFGGGILGGERRDISDSFHRRVRLFLGLQVEDRRRRDPSIGNVFSAYQMNEMLLDLKSRLWHQDREENEENITSVERTRMAILTKAYATYKTNEQKLVAWDMTFCNEWLSEQAEEKVVQLDKEEQQTVAWVLEQVGVQYDL